MEVRPETKNPDFVIETEHYGHPGAKQPVESQPGNQIVHRGLLHTLNDKIRCFLKFLKWKLSTGYGWLQSKFKRPVEESINV